MEIKRLVCGLYAANAYIIDDKYIVDPGDDINSLKKAIPSPEAILLTHGHFDHMLGAEPVQQSSGCSVYVHPADMAMLTDERLSAYDPSVSSLSQPKNIAAREYPDELFGFRVIHTPGHTPGCVCLYNEAEKVLFSGDTLFRAGFGRYDLPGGNMRKLMDSLRMLLALPGDTRVYPGHGEMTTISEECRRYGR